MSSRDTYLVVEPSQFARHRLATALRAEGRDVRLASNANEGLGLIHSARPSLILVSLELPEFPGPRAVEVFAQRARNAAVIAIGGEPSVVDAVHAVRRGAADYVSTQDDVEDIAATVRRVVRAVRLAREERRAGGVAGEHVRQILCQHPDMLRVLEQIRQIGRTDSVALVMGESGTGKELVGRAIHEKSARSGGPFFSVSCGAYGEAALEAELFGHAHGVVPGAGERDGQVAMANGGTLLINEIDAMPPNLQVKLLRLINDGVFHRVGDTEPTVADVRVIAAARHDLEEAVGRGGFREDLYYRICVFPILLPALRDRAADIPLLMRHFLDELARQNDVVAPVVTAAAMEAILRFPWPGNVTQLRSLCEGWVIGSHGARVDLEHVPTLRPHQAEPAPAERSAFEIQVERPLKDNLVPLVEEVERAYLAKVLRRCGGHLGNTADHAGITRRTLYTKMRAYGLEQRDFRGPVGEEGDGDAR